MRSQAEGRAAYVATMKAAMIYRVTGAIRATQILLGHAKIENALCNLGVAVQDALLLVERTEI